MIRTLENDQLRVQINDLGAELTEIYDKTNDRQVLWNADPSYWNRHAPVLFPNVGRYYENKCLINGNTYHCGQHGFARDMEFTCTESSQTSVTHLVTSSDSTRETYPFDFRLLITHELSGRDLTVRWTVINEDSQTMYFTIGGQPLMCLRFRVLPRISIILLLTMNQSLPAVSWTFPTELYLREKPIRLLWNTDAVISKESFLTTILWYLTTGR